jgi:hypothetical protein
MTREDLIKKVALKMDEISSSDDVILSVGSSDNNPLYVQINNLLNESVNDVLMKAPIYRLSNHIVSSRGFKVESIFNGLRQKAVFTITDDFLRFVSISDSCFQRDITELSFEGDSVDKRQHNKHLVSKEAKPVAVLNSTTGHRKISCYSYRVLSSPNPRLTYIERYDHDGDMSCDVDLDGYMIDLVSWVCAGKVFAAQGDINKGKICDENASALMI